MQPDLYTCRFADGRFPTINGKIANFETIEKARKEAKRWGAVEIVICRQLSDGPWVEHATADIEDDREKPWDCCPAEVEATLKNWQSPRNTEP